MIRGESDVSTFLLRLHDLVTDADQAHNKWHMGRNVLTSHASNQKVKLDFPPF